MLIHGRRARLGSRTLLAGVLNVTPDSFSDGGRFLNASAAIRHGVVLAKAGADWIDVGGESTRPGADPVGVEEETRRVLPVIRGLRKRLPRLPISIDTTKAAVAEQAIEAGASIINDVSGLRSDPLIAAVARRYDVPLILMHRRGLPKTMQQQPFVRSVERSVCRGLTWSIERALSLGLRRSQLIIDPGLGFGKSRRQNFELIGRLGILRQFRLPVMIGASRKSFIQAIVAGERLAAPNPVRRRSSVTPQFWKMMKNGAPSSQAALEALNFGDSAAVAAAILAGAHIVRVHNVAAARPAARIADAILAASVL